MYSLTGILACLVIVVSVGGLPRCLWPSGWLNNVYYGDYNEQVFTVNNPTTGVLSNFSRGYKKHTTITECIISEGDYNVVREFGMFFCVKVFVFSNDEIYFYKIPVGSPVLDFCSLCDGGQRWDGPFRISVAGVKCGPKRSIRFGCTVPSSCPVKSKFDIPCTDREPVTNERQHYRLARKYLY